MSKNLYITTTEAKSGKSVISLGMMELIKGVVNKVAFFRPIVNVRTDNGKDPDIDLITSHYNIDIDYDETYAYSFNEAKELINAGKHEELIEGIMSMYKKLEEEYDFIVLEGTDFTGVTTAFEFNINADIANNLGAPVLIVSNGKDKTIADTISSLNLALESFEERGCQILGTIVTRVPMTEIALMRNAMKEKLSAYNMLMYAVPENETLGKITLSEIQKALDAEVLYGEELLTHRAGNTLVAAMQLRNFLNHTNEGCLVITAGDRADIILACVISANSISVPSVNGMVLTGGLKPEENVKTLIKGLTSSFPILCVEHDTMRTASAINRIDTKVAPNDKVKISTALGIFEANVNTEELRDSVIQSRSDIITPKMFEYDLIHKAKKTKQHIVLPEGSETRILKAAEMLIRRDVVELTLLGDESEIKANISKLGIKLPGVHIVNPADYPKFEEYAKTYLELRKHKGITLDNARDSMIDVSYFGTMMVYMGDADGMVSGAVHTTKHTVRPAFEFIKTKKGSSIISSVFFMCLEDEVLVYGDCAVNPNPNEEELAEIAIASAETAKIFGVDPRIAMLSYSTGESGQGEEVEKVRQATKIAHEKAPDLLIEGPIQYDAAVDKDVAKTKMPNSQVAGQATVFIFPDLNTGNNTYKAVQRSADAVAVGPVLQGLRKPVNDLSRGCTVPDIVNTVAITAIQAQTER